jgi:hypothetical protein
MRARKLLEWCRRVVKTASLMSEVQVDECKGDVMQSAQILLCTIASTSRLLREWEEQCGEPLVTHTVIVDECGCTSESSVALLMRLRPMNLIMVCMCMRMCACVYTHAVIVDWCIFTSESCEALLMRLHNE